MPTSEQQIKISHAEKLLLQLKYSFFAELPDRYAKIEDLILELGEDSHCVETYDDLYRQVHSLKGSAGTYGFHSITKVCHHLEDLLNTLQTDIHNISKVNIDICLQYIDLVKQAHKNIRDSQHVETENGSAALDHELTLLRNKTFKNTLSGVVALGSNLMNMICQDSLRQLPVHLSIADNGFNALDRLLQEKFDFLIIGKELQVLNGLGVISALRVSNSNNQHIPIIMVSTKDAPDTLKHIRLDFVISKDKQLGDRLKETIQQIIRSHQERRSSKPANRIS